MKTFAILLVAMSPAWAQLSEQQIKEKRARAEALRTLIEEKNAEIKKIQEGPCMCGAASHGACKTKEVCEPAEAAQMKAISNQAADAAKEYEAIRAAFAAQKQAKKARATALREKNRALQDLQTKLEAELEKVKGLAPEQEAVWKTREGALGVLEFAHTYADDLAELLPENEKAIAKGSFQAVVEAVKAYKAENSEERMEAIGKALLGVRKALGGIEGLGKVVQKMLKVTADVYAIGLDGIMALKEWNQEHNKEKLKERAASILDKTTEVLEEVPATEELAIVGRLAYHTASYAQVAYARYEELESVRLQFDMNVRAQDTLTRKVRTVKANIEFNEQEAARYEK